MTDRTASTAVSRSVVALAAERLITAARTVTATAPVRDVLGATDIALAYDVQKLLTAARLAGGARIVGRKVGLTSPAVQAQLGVDQPDFGVLFDDMLVPDGGAVDIAALIAPKVEAEVAFVLKADLNGDPESIDAATAAAAVDYAVAALEIVDSRVAGWDITITDTVADNASSARYVLGPTRVTLAEFAPVDVTMTLDKNGVRASSGTGAACLGDPLNALAWLARAASEYGSPLRAGDVVLSGALGPMVTAEPGSHLAADISTLGRVSVTFSKDGA
ncbi:2-keto-4-pentenoate hydratase [Pseudonocardia sp. Cha107L01]|uniref:2-keto-4-pentenoate hydratase n=1 Tax=Pseudonocardia sp. Cha107L01 TaxID=3457576 RepID=UPI00403E5187